MMYIALFISTIFYITNGEKSNKDEAQKEVIVVGGGIAGLAAARKLVNTGLYSVSVLEAKRERYGGRIFTDRKSLKRAKGVEVDLGPNWLNSMVKDNPLAKIVTDAELEARTAGKIQLHFPEKDQVLTGDDANKVFTEFYEVTLKAMKKVKDSGTDMDLKTAFSNSLQDHKGVAEKSLLSSIMYSHYTMSLPNHSINNFSPKKEFGWDTTVVDGFDQIVDIIAGGSQSEAPLDIELRKPVRQISVDKKKKKVLVRTKDLKQYEADAVVIALPLGVLKTDQVLFDPPLPKGWKKTIESLGIGYSNKLVLRFDKVFWPEDVGVFTMVTSSESEAGMLQTWVNLHRYVKKPMLMGMLHDKAAVKFENMTDDEIKETAINVLSKLFGKDTMEKVSVSIVTKSKWISDDKFLGTTSYPKVGTLPEMFDTLTRPICPHIYFAGEYTTLEDMNTVHGAYMSGIRAAEQIISKQCDKKVSKTASSTKKENTKANIEKKEKKSSEEKSKKAQKNKKDDETKLKDEL